MNLMFINMSRLYRAYYAYGFVRNLYVELSDEHMIKNLPVWLLINLKWRCFRAAGSHWGSAKLRGFEVNTKYAEAFCVVKQIDKI